MIVGSQGLLLVQSFIAWQLPGVPTLFRILVAITAIVAMAAFISPALGVDRESPQPYWRRRHGR